MAVINMPIGGGFAIPTFDGSHAVFGDEKQGYIECYSSGTITFSKPMPVDIFLVGGGGSGGISYVSGSYKYGGAGGAGGKTLNVLGETVEGSYPVTIGSGGSVASSGYGGVGGGATSFGTHTAAGATGADGGSGGGGGGGQGNMYGEYIKGGAGGEDGSDGTKGSYSPGAGQHTSTRAFLDAAFPLYAGGGGGGGMVQATTGSIFADGGAGGSGGGGQGGSNSGKKALSGTANTGGGGGGSSYATGTNLSYAQSGRSTGGSGIVIIRWGYGAFEIPRFSGNHAVFGTAEKGYIECYSSGTLTFKQGGTVDAFILGSGLAGEKGTATGTGTSSVGTGSSNGGKGGGGATGKTVTGYTVKRGSYPIIVGGVCASSVEPNPSTAFGETANGIASNGGRGGYTYAEWGTGDSSKNTSTSGSKGISGSSYPFGESTLNAAVDPDSIWGQRQLGAGGGGGGARSSGWKYAGGYDGGAYGGGKGGKYSDGVQIDCAPGANNTGSGGGGGGSASYGDSLYEFDGGLGGSGIVIIRWGDWAS